MSAPLRLLFVHGPARPCWKAGFDVAQAAAALDVPVELGFAAEGLGLILMRADSLRGFTPGAYASLELLGIDRVYAPAPTDVSAALPSMLPIHWMPPTAWKSWLRRAPVQVW